MARRPRITVKRATLASSQPAMTTSAASSRRGMKAPIWNRKARSGSRCIEMLFMAGSSLSF